MHKNLFIDFCHHRIKILQLPLKLSELDPSSPFDGLKRIRPTPFFYFFWFSKLPTKHHLPFLFSIEINIMVLYNVFCTKFYSYIFVTAKLKSCDRLWNSWILHTIWWVEEAGYFQLPLFFFFSFLVFLSCQLINTSTFLFSSDHRGLFVWRS